MGKTYEMGGQGSIVLRALCDFDKYKKDQVLAVIHDVGIQFNFSTTFKNASAKNQIVLQDYQKYLDSIVITDIAIHDRILNLYFENQTNLADYYTVCEDLVIEDSTMFLSKKPILGSIQISLERAFDYKEDSNSIVFEDEEGTLEKTKCTVYYKVQVKSTSYVISEMNYLPYLNLEIQFNGNIQKDNGQAIMHIPYVKSNDMPSLTVDSNNIFSYSLGFQIIHNGEPDNIITIDMVE